MKMLILPVALVLLAAAEARAIKVTAFSDTATFVEQAKDVVVAKCLGPVPDGTTYEDGLYPVDVDVTAVLKGEKKPGKTKVATVYPMEAGKTYLLTSMGGSAYGADLLAVPELAVVEVPRDVRPDDLKGKGLVEQVRAVFAARRRENERRQRELAAEKKLLDKAVLR